MKVRIYTLGCKVNQFESGAIIKQLTEKGYEAAEENEKADITIINSCAVTAASEQKAYKLIRRIRREEPDTVILFTGCMAQLVNEDSKLSDSVDIIVGNKRRGDIIRVLEDYFARKEKIIRIEPYQRCDQYENLIADNFSDRTRAFLKIEDGCNRFCSYCIIPYARGRVRSCSLEYIDKQIKAFAAKGYKEVVVVGINLSSYGSDIGCTFSDAIKTACEAADIRIRLGSLEPESMDPDTLSVFSSYENFCPQFHLSLQSGCDETLKRMNRHYTTAEYSKIVSDIRNTFDNPSITTDVMVGFCGETEEEFEKSVGFVKKTGFAKVHVFPYSRRPGTAADRAVGHLSNEVKKRRAELMSEVAEESRRDFLKNQVGRTEKVLLETRRKDGKYEGYTPNYTPVLVTADESLVNTVVKVKIEGTDGYVCFGDII